MSQRDLAELLGTSQPYVSNLERGKGISPTHLRELSELLLKSADRGRDAVRRQKKKTAHRN